jgi:hypothetical protein
MGYGTLSRQLAHRIYYKRMRGPIPSDRELDHLCRIPPCVNPDHLEPVTRAINVARGANTKIDSETARVIRALSPEFPYSMLVAQFGVGKSTISRIVRDTRAMDHSDVS